MLGDQGCAQVFTPCMLQQYHCLLCGRALVESCSQSFVLAFAVIARTYTALQAQNCWRSHFVLCLLHQAMLLITRGQLHRGHLHY